jgi:hypothetical protein
MVLGPEVWAHSLAPFIADTIFKIFNGRLFSRKQERLSMFDLFLLRGVKRLWELRIVVVKLPDVNHGGRPQEGCQLLRDQR